MSLNCLVQRETVPLPLPEFLRNEASEPYSLGEQLGLRGLNDARLHLRRHPCLQNVSRCHGS